jgi:glycosyltransferase involved in cell wall biosynthesis
LGYENFFEFIDNVDFKIAYVVNSRLQTFRLGSGYMKFLNGLTNPSGSLSQSALKKRNEHLKVLLDASLISNHEDTGLSKYTKGLARSLYDCENIDLYLILQDLDIFPGLKCNKILFDTVLNVDIRAKFINHIVGNYDIDLFISPYFDVPVGIQCKTVQVVLDLIPLRFPAFYESSNSYAFFNERIRRSCSYVDLILTISRATQKDIQYFYVVSPSKICVAYPGLGINSKSISAHQPDRSIIKRSFFLYVGTLEPRKGVTLLLEAYEAFRVKLESAGAEGLAIPDLCLVGKFGWDCEKEKALISKLKCHGVKHLGYVNDDTLVSFYRNAVGSIFPSYYEGFGLPIIESFHYGAPVITLKNSSLNEVAGDAALYPSTQDVEGLSVAMFTLFSDPDLAKTLIRKGKKRAEFFTWDNHRKMLYSGISGLFPRWRGD